MASTASGRCPRQPRRPAVAASTVNPANAAARAGMLRLSVGNGWTRVMRPTSVSSWRTIRPSQPGSMRWCWYHGSEVTTCSSWPRAASSVPMLVITSPVGAVSGA
jgi:hypothetical protein